MSYEDHLKLIEVKGLSFGYQTSPILLFENLTLHVNQNEIISVLGESGSGKTTLLKLLAGLEIPSAGEVLRHCSTKGSFVFQTPVLLDWLNVAENITFPEKPDSVNGKLKDLLAEVELSSAKAKFPRELSGGMRSRVQLARALYRRPKILFLDEAFSSLDEKLRHQLNLLLKSLREKHKFSAVLVSHPVQEAVFLSDRIFIIKKDPHNSSSAVIQEFSEGLRFSSTATSALEDKDFNEQVGRVRLKLISKESTKL